MTNNDTATDTAALRASLDAAADRRRAEYAQIAPYRPARPADRSRNGMRTPRSVRHRGLR